MSWIGIEVLKEGGRVGQVWYEDTFRAGLKCLQVPVADGMSWDGSYCEPSIIWFGVSKAWAGIGTGLMGAGHRFIRGGLYS
jgi:hypothetical protein